jgi:hypothetical protein
LSAFESAALAERLLNDLLKTTEGFQRLKKMNEELKQQSGGMPGVSERIDDL